MTNFEIRESVPGDLSAIEAIYPDAFPEEDLVPLVRDLAKNTPGTLALVAIANKAIAGHIVFTPCGVAGRSGEVALMGPLAVAGAWQGRGIGSALVRAGLDRLQLAGYLHVYVLGDPAYYRRFGFEAEASVAPPYPLPEAWRGAWQSKRLESTAPHPKGLLRVPPVWNQPALWAP